MISLITLETSVTYYSANMETGFFYRVNNGILQMLLARWEVHVEIAAWGQRFLLFGPTPGISGPRALRTNHIAEFVTVPS